jgi:glycopeptide antibiotics resistance protein
MGVVRVIIFPFPVDIPIHYFKPSIHWIPFAFGSCEMINLCITGIIDNILLTIPFGFGINFIARVTPQIVFWLAITVGLIFEMLQLVISLIIRNPFRSVDINDVLLNATGVLLGNGIFKLFGWLFSYLTDRFEILNQYIFANISDVIHQNQ